MKRTMTVQMSSETKGVLAPLAGVSTEESSTAILEALHTGVPGHTYSALRPLIDRIGALDGRIWRNTERVRARVDQIMREHKAAPGTPVNDPTATYRALAQDADTAARDATERALLTAELRLLAQLLDPAVGA